MVAVGPGAPAGLKTAVESVSTCATLTADEGYAGGGDGVCGPCGGSGEPGGYAVACPATCGPGDCAAGYGRVGRVGVGVVCGPGG